MTNPEELSLSLPEEPTTDLGRLENARSYHLRHLAEVSQTQGTQPAADHLLLDLFCGAPHSTDNLYGADYSPTTARAAGEVLGRDRVIGIDNAPNPDEQSYQHVALFLEPDTSIDDFIRVVAEQTGREVQPGSLFAVLAQHIFEPPSPTLRRNNIDPDQLRVAVIGLTQDLLAPKGLALIEEETYQKQDDGTLTLLPPQR